MKILLLLAAASFLIGCSSIPKETRDHRPWLYNAKTWEPEYLPKDSGGSGVIFRYYGEKYPVNVVQDFNYSFWAYPLDTVASKYTSTESIVPVIENRIEVTHIYYEINNNPIHVAIKADSADEHKFSDPNYQLRDYDYNVISKTDSTDKYAVELPPNTYLLTFRPIYTDPRFGFSNQFIMKDLIVKRGYWSIVRIVFHRDPHSAPLIVY